MQLSIANVINIQVAAAGMGLGRYNTSNMAIFTKEPYDVSKFGDKGFKIYLSPSEVGIDFGTNSVTYAQANAVFNQQPNILAGRGYLVVIPMIPNQSVIEFSGIAASGKYNINYGPNASADIPYDASLEDIQDAVAGITGIPEGTIVSLGESNTVIIGFPNVPSPLAVTVSGNTLEDADANPITDTVTTESEESLDETVIRAQSLVQYCGAVPAFLPDDLEILSAAQANQSYLKLLGVPLYLTEQIEENGIGHQIQQASLKRTRAIYYGSGTPKDCLAYIAGYFSRLMSVDFSGSNTTITMHLKDIVGSLPDETVTQTLLQECKTTGVDLYPNIEGIGKVFCSGANDFADQVYNLIALVGDLQIAGFNLYGQTPTKVPQTEEGMDLLKKKYDEVIAKYKRNGFVAAGRWTLPNTFGNQEDFLANILSEGYYIYSIPIVDQSAPEREERAAPLVQIAIKEAGAQHSSGVLINVNK